MARFGVRVYKQAFNFAAAHFLIFADGTREPLHGHNYQVQVQVMGELGQDDMVLDMLDLKPLVKRCCDALDHRVLLPERHPALSVQTRQEAVEVTFARTGGADRFLFPASDVVILPLANTSTERLAEHLAAQLLEAIAAEVPQARIDRVAVEVEETGGQCGLYETEAG
jgi:6-pyruvoyltetrahydropterin/6-carboxytetrahydropterin synthase